MAVPGRIPRSVGLLLFFVVLPAVLLQPGCGAAIDSQTGEDIDSCWGFIGDDDSVLEAMKAHVEEVYHARLERSWRDRYE